MDKTVIINVNLDVKCKRCGKEGAVVNAGNICMACIAKAIKQGEFDHIFKGYRDEAKKKLSP